MDLMSQHSLRLYNERLLKRKITHSALQASADMPAGAPSPGLTDLIDAALHPATGGKTTTQDLVNLWRLLDRAKAEGLKHRNVNLLMRRCDELASRWSAPNRDPAPQVDDEKLIGAPQFNMSLKYEEQQGDASIFASLSEWLDDAKLPPDTVQAFIANEGTHPRDVLPDAPPRILEAALRYRAAHGKAWHMRSRYETESTGLHEQVHTEAAHGTAEIPLPPSADEDWTQADEAWTQAALMTCHQDDDRLSELAERFSGLMRCSDTAPVSVGPSSDVSPEFFSHRDSLCLSSRTPRNVAAVTMAAHEEDEEDEEVGQARIVRDL